ncbi:TPM domain-containing protein [Aquabacter spiritensis]|uniref:Putative membrane protein n=1 Tax=Aquabacter spiritensis TaxID=933073 RepID=A0A4R3LPS1_9HYPH|nr:TPM domain-containing protein [Aquabacter spiritensis]TCT02494.1 putative membrane protein [Aquabacter spiritensis]
MAHVPPLTPDEHRRIADAVAAAEAKTSAEIRVALVEAPLVTHAYHPVLWAALGALVLPWPAIAVFPIEPLRLLAVQAAAFVLFWGGLALPPVSRRLVPMRERRAAARAMVRQLFVGHGMHGTEGRSGLLILVASRDRIVEILADANADAALGAAAWAEVCRTVTAPAAEGRLADGIVAAVARAGDLLSGPLPARSGDRNELPNAPITLGGEAGGGD